MIKHGYAMPIPLFQMINFWQADSSMMNRLFKQKNLLENHQCNSQGYLGKIYLSYLNLKMRISNVETR